MPELTTERDLQRARRLPFCYLCGKTFEPTDNITRDHIPPKAIFAVDDRVTPLVLPTHRTCNEQQSPRDKVIGQLIAVQHKKYPTERDAHLKVDVFEVSELGKPLAGFRDTGLQGAIARWVKGFHAALYQEPLPASTKNAIHPPFASGQVEDGKLKLDELLVQQPLFVEIIKGNRLAKRLDRIVCYNGKCVYECTWERMDDGSWACFFALNIYDWRKLGDPVHFAQRGCVGWYQPAKGIPLAATHGIMRLLSFPISNQDPLDPFGP